MIDSVNRRVSSTESIKRFAILERDFEITRDEITPTGKLKRDVIVERFRDVIDKLYLVTDEHR
jgi:long-chain acyl-CoA synthetase